MVTMLAQTRCRFDETQLPHKAFAGHMTISSELRKFVQCAAFVAAAFFVMPNADAQQRPSEKSLDLGGPAGYPNNYYAGRGPRGVDGYPLTLGWIWGPAKMPPPPTDFGPYFDYPSGYTLNGPPNQSPYPN